MRQPVRIAIDGRGIFAASQPPCRSTVRQNRSQTATMQTEIWKYLAPLAILAFLVAYTRVARRMKIPKPVYWMTMIAGGFLLMSLFTVGA